MKILILNNYYPEHFGGIEFVAHNLVKQYRKKNPTRWIACDVAQSPHKKSSGDIPLQAINFTETRMGFPYPIPVGNSIRNIFNQVRWCDVLHIHDCLYPANLIAFIASRLYKKPVLLTQHIAPIPYNEAYKNILQAIAYKTIGKFMLENSEKVVFISERVRTWFQPQIQFKQKPELIINGVDHALFFPASSDERKKAQNILHLPQEAVILLFVGRFTQKKGLDIIKKIAQNRPQYYWCMIGRSGEYDPVEWGLPNVKVLPPQDQTDLRNFYISSDLLILPAIGEGFPLVIQEALSCGTPAAVSSEIFSHLPDAPLTKLDDGNILNTLNILDNLLTDKENLIFLKEKALHYAKDWDWSAVTQKYENLLNELIKNS